jgi:orotidine-5'-phosphate decarboxylase
VSDVISPARFVEAFAGARRASGANLCVGLDPEPARLPEHLSGASGLLQFCAEIIDATSDLVCAYKPNVAFFERFGSAGWSALEQLMSMIPSTIPVIVDAKRGDMGNTSRAYADSIFSHLGAGACTVSPYLGLDAVTPFLDHPRGFVFVLCRTSNPGAADIQDLDVGGMPLYAHVIRLFQAAIESDSAGLVIGAQARNAFAWAARLSPRAPILVPGVGAQGGSISELASSLSPRQARNVVVSVSRAIIHVSRDRDFAMSARASALSYLQQLREHVGILVEGDGASAG